MGDGVGGRPEGCRLMRANEGAGLAGWLIWVNLRNVGQCWLMGVAHLMGVLIGGGDVQVG